MVAPLGINGGPVPAGGMIPLPLSQRSFSPPQMPLPMGGPHGMAPSTISPPVASSMNGNPLHHHHHPLRNSMHGSLAAPTKPILGVLHPTPNNNANFFIENAQANASPGLGEQERLFS